jgi:uncharacterized membrane protein YgcG
MSYIVKIIFISLFCSNVAFSQTYISDDGEYLYAPEEAFLQDTLQQFNKKNNCRIVVITGQNYGEHKDLIGLMMYHAKQRQLHLFSGTESHVLIGISPQSNQIRILTSPVAHKKVTKKELDVIVEDKVYIHLLRQDMDKAIRACVFAIMNELAIKPNK